MAKFIAGPAFLPPLPQEWVHRNSHQKEDLNVDTKIQFVSHRCTPIETNGAGFVRVWCCQCEGALTLQLMPESWAVVSACGSCCSVELRDPVVKLSLCPSLSLHYETKGRHTPDLWHIRRAHMVSTLTNLPQKYERRYPNPIAKHLSPTYLGGNLFTPISVSKYSTQFQGSLLGVSEPFAFFEISLMGSPELSGLTMRIQVVLRGRVTKCILQDNRGSKTKFFGFYMCLTSVTETRSAVKRHTKAVCGNGLFVAIRKPTNNEITPGQLHSPPHRCFSRQGPTATFMACLSDFPRSHNVRVENRQLPGGARSGTMCEQWSQLIVLGTDGWLYKGFSKTDLVSQQEILHWSNNTSVPIRISGFVKRKLSTMLGLSELKRYSAIPSTTSWLAWFATISVKSATAKVSWSLHEWTSKKFRDTSLCLWKPDISIDCCFPPPASRRRLKIQEFEKLSAMFYSACVFLLFQAELKHL